LNAVCDEVVVVLAPDAQAPGLADAVRIARDDVVGQGPLAGLLAGMAASSTGWVLVAAGDMPELAELVLREMLRVAREGSARAVVLQDGDHYRPLPAALRTPPALVTARLLFDSGERRLRALMEALDRVVLDQATWTALDPRRRTLRDVDERGDLPTG